MSTEQDRHDKLQAIGERFKICLRAWLLLNANKNSDPNKIAKVKSDMLRLEAETLRVRAECADAAATAALHEGPIDPADHKVPDTLPEDWT